MITPKKPIPTVYRTSTQGTGLMTSSDLNGTDCEVPVEEPVNQDVQTLIEETNQSINVADKAQEAIEATQRVAEVTKQTSESSHSVREVLDKWAEVASVEEVSDEAVPVCEVVSVELPGFKPTPKKLRVTFDGLNSVRSYPEKASQTVEPISESVSDVTDESTQEPISEPLQEPTTEYPVPVETPTVEEGVVEDVVPQKELPTEPIIEKAPEAEKPFQPIELSSKTILEKAEVPTVLVPDSKPEQPAIHYFYCKKPDGTEATYTRNTAAKTYKSEVIFFRRHLASQGIEILREEIK